MLQNWRVWTPTETGREHAMVKIPPMMGSGIQRRHAAIFGESPENIGELRKPDSKWMVLKMDDIPKTINLPKMQRTRVAAYMILGDPFLVMARAPIFPEYDVTPQPDPMRPAQRQATPSIKIPLLTPSDGTGGAATILAAAK